MINTKGNLLHKNTDSSTSNNNENSSNKKYQKFPSFAHQLKPSSTLKRQVSLQVENKFDKSEEKIVFYKQINQGKSQSSLRSCQTPRKVPMTPRKHMAPSSHSRKKIPSPATSIKEVIFELHQLIDDFSHLLESMRFQIAMTIQNVMKNVEKQMKGFLNEYSLNERSDIIFSTATFGQNQSKQINHQIDQLRNLENLVAKSKIVRAQSISEQFEIFERSNTGTHTIQQQKHRLNEKQKQKGGIFSNMIKMRQNIRKDATNAIPKRPVKKFVQQDQNTNKNDITPDKRREILRKTVPFTSGNREMTKSIEKIQLRLSSLKNLLDQ